MNKKQIIYLTKINTILSEKGKEKLDKVKNKKSDPDSMPYEWYLENGLRPPPGLEPSEEIDEDGMIELKEGEYTYEFKELVIDIQDFFYAEEASTVGSIVVFHNGEEFHVEEDAMDVYALIYLAQRTWFEKLIDKLRWKKN